MKDVLLAAVPAVVGLVFLLLLPPVACELEARGYIEDACRRETCSALLDAELETFHECVRTCKRAKMHRRRRENRERIRLWWDE